jgi:hypothetical protein
VQPHELVFIERTGVKTLVRKAQPQNPTVMKTKTLILILALIVGVLAGTHLQKFFKAPAPVASGQISLEEVLAIKELHLVKHTYRDLFFLHRKNDPEKSIRAIVEVPVTVTSYINLKEIKIIRENDTIRTIILPSARLNAPAYDLDKMAIRKTRSMQFHLGNDLYPEVSSYLQHAIVQRIDSISNVAVRNQILEQAEAEGKEYIESVLKGIGRDNVRVTFGDEEKDERISSLQAEMQ